MSIIIPSRTGQKEALRAIKSLLKRLISEDCVLMEPDMSRANGYQEWLCETISHGYYECSVDCPFHRLTDLLGELSDPDEGMDLPQILTTSLEITKALLAKAPKASVSKAPKAGIAKAQ